MKKLYRGKTRALRESMPPPRHNTCTIAYDCNDWLWISLKLYQLYVRETPIYCENLLSFFYIILLKKQTNQITNGHTTSFVEVFLMLVYLKLLCRNFSNRLYWLKSIQYLLIKLKPRHLFQTKRAQVLIMYLDDSTANFKISLHMEYYVFQWFNNKF